MPGDLLLLPNTMSRDEKAILTNDEAEMGEGDFHPIVVVIRL